MHWVSRIVAAVSVAIGSGVAHSQPCVPQWETAFGMPSTPNGPAWAVASGGTQLFVGGGFHYIGSWIPNQGFVNVGANGLACWDGYVWREAWGGVNGPVEALLVTGYGTGAERLYVGGWFNAAGGTPAPCIAQRDVFGPSWSSLGAGFNGPVFALAEHDDGTGPALFAAGAFSRSGAQPLHGIAKWNGQHWLPLGGPISNGVDDFVYALQAFDPDGIGPVPRSLYVGGAFTRASGGVAASRVARWDGEDWHSVAGGLDGPVYAMHVTDLGQGPTLFIGGTFASLGYVAQLVGASWEVVGGSVSGGAPYSGVFALMSIDDGSGRALYVGGDFVGGPRITFGPNGLARWDGTQWKPASRDAHSGNRVTALGSSDFLSPSVGLIVASDNGAYNRPADAFRMAKLNACPPPIPCYADCDPNTGRGNLDIFDFLCFQNRYTQNDPYACDCDRSSGTGLCDIFDFLCFQNAFVAGCP